MAQRKLSKRCRGVACNALVLAVVCMLGLSVAHADTSEVLKKIESNMSQTTTVASAFVQKKYMSIFDNVMEINGHIALEKPGRFAWHVQKPLRFSMVLDGHKMKSWDEDTNKVQSFSMNSNPIFKAAVGQMRQWFEGEYQKLTDEYDIVVLDGLPLTLKFSPLPSNPAKNYIKNIEVSFRDDMRYINKIVIFENNNDKTELEFLASKLDIDLPLESWELGD